MTKLGQTRLNFNGRQPLSFVDINRLRRNPGSQLYSSDAAILRLPDELLGIITEYACFEGSSTTENFHRNEFAYNATYVRSHSLVCQRLNILAQPLLFRSIELDRLHPAVPPSQKAMKLHRTLMERLDLRKHCRSLNVFVHDKDPNLVGCSSPFTNHIIVLDLLSWLKRTKHLTINNRRKPDCVADLIRCANENMPTLKHFGVYYTGRMVETLEVLELLLSKNLEMLQWSGMDGNDESLDLKNEQYRTMSIKSLCLPDIMGAPQSIARLVQWPVALTHFDCKVIWGQDINYKFLESCLLKHKNTLTHIRLGGCLARGNDGCTFDTRRFPNLQYLQVDYYDILASIWRNDRLNLHTNLLGPNLKVFVIDFQYRHCLDSEWCLGKEDISWLREFMQGAIAQRASLKTIKLIFDRHHLHTANDRGSYSRDRVAKTKAQIMELSGGIELEWCELVQPTRTWAESKAAEILQRRIRYCGTEEEDMDLDDYIDSLQL